MMYAYRIDEDFSITRVDDAAAEMKARAWDWDRLDYDDRNDVWCNDWGLIEAEPVLAWIGQARRVPLPAYILGGDGEDSCAPYIAMDEMRFGRERDQSSWPVRTDASGQLVIGLDPSDVIADEHDRG
jgi:hypothetical protein